MVRDAPHGDGGDRQEARRLAAGEAGVAHHPEVDLVDDLGGRERLVGSPAPQRAVGDLPELLIHQRREPVERLPVAAGEREERVSLLVRSVHARIEQD